jgi:mRNA-degrading endonuclease toxin of MazEF toxin-antitoxin module
MKRGDVVLVRFPHPSGQRGKKRPAVVVQSDAYASTRPQAPPACVQRTFWPAAEPIPRVWRLVV